MSCRIRAKNPIRMQSHGAKDAICKVRLVQPCPTDTQWLNEEIGKVSIFSLLASCFLLLIKSHKYRRGEATGNSTVLGWKWRIWYKLMALCLSKNIKEDTGIETNVHAGPLHSFCPLGRYKNQWHSRSNGHN